jgi:hypothetical protein
MYAPIIDATEHVYFVMIEPATAETGEPYRETPPELCDETR